MRNDEIGKKRNFFWQIGYRIFIKTYSANAYKIVVSKATKYKWSDIPPSKKSEFEMVDGVIYSLNVGKELYKTAPGITEPKWWEKINELYVGIHDKIIKEQQLIKIESND